MITFEALDVILRVQNLPGFMARMRAGARSVRSIGAAAVNANQRASAALLATARKATLSVMALASVTAAAGYKMSVEFEKQLTLVHTQAGASRAEMMAFKQPLLDLAKTLPQGPIELAKGLYHIKSIGIPAAQALNALKVAAQGAMVGNADLEQTTSALGAAWLAGIEGAGNFRQTMSILNATVGAGNMRMDELVTALGSGVLPTAKLAGLSIQDVMAALALLKDEGYGAYGAMAQFATALHFFTDPTKKAQDAFKKLGLSQLDLADTMRKRGMVPTLAMLRDRLKLTGDELARMSKKDYAPQTQQEKLLGDILPGGRGRVFRVLLNQVDRYQMKIDQINRTSKNFGGAIAATQETAAARLHIAWSSVQVDLIRLGDMIRGPGTSAIIFLIGVFDRFIGILIGIPAAIKAIINAWQSVPGPLKVIIALVALMLAQFALFRAGAFAIVLLEDAWIALRLAIWDAEAASVAFLATNAWLLVIMLVIAGIILLVMKWKWLRHAAVDAWNWVKNAAMDAWSWIKDHWELLAITIGLGFGVLAVLIAKHWGAVKNAAAVTFHWIVGHWRLLAVILGGPLGVLVVMIVNNWRRIRDAAVFAFEWIARHWRTILLLTGPVGVFAEIVIDHWHAIRNAAVAAWRAVVRAGRNAIRWLNGAWNSIKNNKFVQFMTGLVGAQASLAGKGFSILGKGADLAEKGLGGGYTGGRVTAGGVMNVGEHGIERVFLPGGSFIQPAGFRSMPGGAAAMAGGSGILEVHLHNYLDGKEVAENVSRHQLNKKARK
jgi:TP901 family phage tail tape measure protein